MELSRNATEVLNRRYLKKDAEGNVTETPEDMFRRVARHVASAETIYSDNNILAEGTFYDMMTELKFLPNSPTLMNAGRELGQLAACFVLPIEDSIGGHSGIFSTLKNAALIHKSGGGTGFSFSRLRPKGSIVGSTGGVASGPVSFMRIYNAATEEIKQGGTRRGANMAVLRVDHPDIMEFIYCKNDGSLSNFNISVGITKVFMEAVNHKQHYSLINPHTNTVAGVLSAESVYQAIVEQAWKTGDPGVIFLDRINADNPTPHLGDIESTNPCGEQPLLPYEACTLGSINLAKFVTKIALKTIVDYDELKKITWNAVRFLDNTINVSKYPLPQIEEMTKGNRKIGLGVMGFADMLYQLEVPYNSEEALEIASDVMSFISVKSYEASEWLARGRGTYPNHSKGNREYRNATVTTIAPTGTLSIIAGCSSGIEPLFALGFIRTVMDNDNLVEINPYFKKALKDHGVRSINDLPENIRKIFVTAHDIAPEWHIRMQAEFQKYTDNAVSKTVNLPHSATVEDVKNIYTMAYDLSCKGVTVYRDGSKENQVLKTVTDTIKNDDAIVELIGSIRIIKRPETLTGFTTGIKTGMGQLYITVNEYEGQPFEVFATIGKSGRSTAAKAEAIGRLVSLALRSGVAVDKIVNQLKGIGGELPVFRKGGLVLSIPDAIGTVLENKYLSKKIHNHSFLGEKCPECGQVVVFEEGCIKCHACGFTKC